MTTTTCVTLAELVGSQVRIAVGDHVTILTVLEQVRDQYSGCLFSDPPQDGHYGHEAACYFVADDVTAIDGPDHDGLFVIRL